MYCGLRDWLFCWLTASVLITYVVSGCGALFGCCGNLMLLAGLVDWRLLWWFWGFSFFDIVGVVLGYVWFCCA